MRDTGQYYIEAETDHYGTFRVRVLRDEERHSSDGDAIAVIEEFKVEVWPPREWEQQSLTFPVEQTPNVTFPSTSSRGTSPTLAWYIADAIRQAVHEANEMTHRRASAIRTFRRMSGVR